VAGESQRRLDVRKAAVANALWRCLGDATGARESAGAGTQREGACKVSVSERDAKRAEMGMWQS